MLRGLSQKKLIFAGLFLAVVFAGGLFGKTELPQKRMKAVLWRGLEKLSFSVFGQGTPTYFFPFGPQRLTYLVSEIAAVSEELTNLNESLNNAVAGNAGAAGCDCKYASSVCQSGGGGLNIGVSALPFPARTLGSLYLEKELTAHPLATLGSIAGADTGETAEKLKNWMEQDAGDAYDNFLNEAEKSLSTEDWERFKDDLKKISISQDIKTTVDNVVKDLGIKFTENPEQVSNEIRNQWKSEVETFYQGLTESIREQGSLGFQAESFKRQIADWTNDLVGEFNGFFQDLKSFVTGFPMCRATGVSGDICPEKGDIEDKQLEISDKIWYLQELKKTLQLEMQEGLKEELETLEPEHAQAIITYIEELIGGSPAFPEGFIDQIISSAGKNKRTPSSCSVSKCWAACKAGTPTTLQACVAYGAGEQRQTEVKFNAGVSLQDLQLKPIGLKDARINLPETIPMPTLPELPSVKVPIPDFSLKFPIKQKEIVFSAPQADLPESPSIVFSCPASSPSSYQCSVAPSETEKPYNDAQWYFETFSWLSEKCQELPEMKGEMGMPVEDQIVKCLDQENVHQTIIQECDAFWSSHKDSSSAPSICQLMEKPCLKKAKAVERECQNLFSQEGKAIPSSCNLDIKCSILKSYCSGTEFCYATDDNAKKSLETLEKECEQIKQSGKDIVSGEDIVPESCKYLPLFTGKIKPIETLEYTEPERKCPGQIISQGANALQSPWCVPTGSWKAPSPLKIPLSKYSVKIPDIHLPHIKLWPFFDVKLPNFIFEDLILPDIEPCNLDDCQGSFPYLSIKIPSLDIPDIEVSSQVNIPGMPPLDLKTEPISFSSLPLRMPQINLGSLLSLKFGVPEIPLPKPQLNLKMGGFKFDALGLLLGLFKIPSASYCGKVDIPFKSLSIYMPDYYFYWREFPRIPELQFCRTDRSTGLKKCTSCKDIRNVCREAKGSLQEVVDKKAEIEAQFNKVFQSEVQNKLNQLAQEAAKEIKTQLQSELDKRADKIKTELETSARKWCAMLFGAQGYVVIPPSCSSNPVETIYKECERLAATRNDLVRKYCGGDFFYTLIHPDDISLLPIPLGDLARKKGVDWPSEIPIPWPDRLTNPLTGSAPVCGNGKCERGETYKDCPADCTIRTCGNGSCDSIVGETKSACPTDCQEDPFTYEIPPILLSKLGYSKQFPLKLPGLQKSTPTIDLSLSSGYPACTAEEPKGGNPCSTDQMTKNYDEIKNLKSEIERVAKGIIDIL